MGLMKEWVIDLTLWDKRRPDLFCFCPIEDRGGPNESIIFGLALLTSLDGFGEGRLIGVIYADGEEALTAWLRDNPEAHQRVIQRLIQDGVEPDYAIGG